MKGVDQKSRVLFPFPECSEGRTAAVVEMDHDQESSGSEVESPRSVAAGLEKWKKGMRISTDDIQYNKLRASHGQIMRIRAEDSHLGEGVGEGNNLMSCCCSLIIKDNNTISTDHHRRRHHHHHRKYYGTSAHFMVYSRPILPASPLSGKK